MASIVNEIVSVIVKLVITVAGTAFMTYGIPYLKQIGMYKIVQMAVRAAEKLGVTGAIQKADKKKYVIAAFITCGGILCPLLFVIVISGKADPRS